MSDADLRHDELHLTLQDADTDVYEDGKADENGTYFVAVADGEADENENDEDDEELAPAVKRPRLDDCDIAEDGLPSLQQILYNMNKSMCDRLDSIEKKLEMLDRRTQSLEERLERASPKPLLSVQPSQSSRSSHYPSMKTSSGAIIIGLPQEKLTDDDAGCDESNSNSAHKYDDATTKGLPTAFDCSDLHGLGSSITLITLNSEDDFPNGSWLGNDNIPDQRVRVLITQSDLLHIESNCRTPEKMALALLDYLFDRDVQACSNLSGLGKHGKKKLDPLFIYGMRCHLVHRFGISEKDWHRIKLNIDSKCRTAFRRKMRGQSLSVKAFRSKALSTYMYVQVGDRTNGESDDDLSLQAVSNSLQINEAGDVVVEQGGVQHSAGNSQFQVVTATPEQVARLKPRLQLLTDGQYVLQAGLGMNSQDGVNLSTDDIISIVTSDSGELIQIMPEADVEDSVANCTSVGTGIS